MLHFVRFKGEEYLSAVQVFGKPDFFHRQNDIRLLYGGEVAENDILVFANNSENKFSKWAFNDSAVM